MVSKRRRRLYRASRAATVGRHAPQKLKREKGWSIELEPSNGSSSPSHLSTSTRHLASPRHRHRQRRGSAPEDAGGKENAALEQGERVFLCVEVFVCSKVPRGRGKEKILSFSLKISFARSPERRRRRPGSETLFEPKSNASIPSRLAVSAAPPPGRAASPSRRLRGRQFGGGFLQRRVAGGKKGWIEGVDLLSICRFSLAYFVVREPLLRRTFQTDVEKTSCLIALEKRRRNSR